MFGPLSIRNSLTVMDLHTERGQALVEFVFMAAMLIVMVFGLLDFGRAIYDRQILINLSREAANLSSRGTALDKTAGAINISAQPLDLVQEGCVILSVVERDENGDATIVEQFKMGRFSQPSQVGTGVGSVPNLPATDVPVPVIGDKLYIAEIYHRYEPVTPLGQLIGATMPSVLSDIAYF